MVEDIRNLRPRGGGRRHRGPHPLDRDLFGPAHVPTLRRATEELSWLLTRGYATPSAMRVVGDRHALAARQRLAVKRCACSEAERAARRARLVDPTALQGARIWIDGFNVLTTVEAALGGAPLLVARDGAIRDMVSMHGSYRRVEETRPALEAIAGALARRGVAQVRWLLDAPVSNSGRLARIVAEVGRLAGGDWSVEVVQDPDPLLIDAVDAIVASADSRVLDGAGCCWHLAREVVEQLPGPLWLVDLGDEPRGQPDVCEIDDVPGGAASPTRRPSI